MQQPGTAVRTLKIETRIHMKGGSVMDARINFLSARRFQFELLEGDLMQCLERREDALSAGRIDLVRHYERRLVLTDYMMRKTAA